MLIHPSPRHPDRSHRRSRALSRTRGHLVASGLELRQSSGAAIRGLDLDARPGSTTHIIGTTTTDTTSLLGVLVGLFEPEAGTIHLDGRDVTQLSLTTTRRSVALVLADPWIMDTTIADNIAFGDPGVSRKRIETVATLACVDEFAQKTAHGLDSRIRTADGTDGIELSIGQRRLVALARALLRDPAVLLLEDPLRALSAREETQAIKAINRARANRTTILTTTNFNGTVFPRDQVFRFERGGLIPTAVADVYAVLDHREETPRVGEIAPGLTASSLQHRSDRTETWRAERTDGGVEHVAVKVPRRLPVSDYTRVELAAEYERSTRLQHPGLARPLEAELTSDQPFAIYEWVDGPTLAELAADSGSNGLDPNLVLRVGADLARTLAYLHRLGYAHLGLTPEVVSNEPGGAIITDLRHALPLGARPLRGQSLRSEWAEPASAATDMYALGTILQSLMADVPESVAAIITDLTDPDPDKRPTAQKVLAVLRPKILPVSPRPEVTREQVGTATDRAIA